MSEEANKILSEISNRILDSNWEKLDELFDLVPETIEKSLLAKKYFWKGRYFWDRSEDNINAIHYFELISKEWDKSFYYSAKLWLGRIYLKSNKNLAREYWSNISEENGVTYFHAQFEIAQMYFSEQSFSKAAEHLLNAEMHALDQDKHRMYMWIVASYRLNNENNKAIKYLDLMSPANSKEQAEIIVQDYLLNIHDEDSLKKLLAIKEIDGWPYEWAQIILGNETWKTGEKHKAIRYWLKIKKQNCSEYIEAQMALYSLGITYYLENNEYSRLKILLSNIKLAQYQYDVNILMKIVDLGLSKKIIKKILELYRKIKEIKQVLHIRKDVVHRDFDISHYCSKFAHYTSCTVAKSILGDQGSLQLSVADLMNDPTEGKILHDILGQPDWLTHRFNHRYYQAYASCFSFNHDSLNQFRLYGKESGKEATGASMVFDLSMFSGEEYSANISTVLPTLQTDKKVHVDDNSDTPSKIKVIKLPLYRCVYFDPKSGYYKLASRAEMTFYRQGEIDGKTYKVIDEEWQKYSKVINRKENILKKLFLDLEQNICEIKKLMHGTTGKKIAKQDIINLVNDILLPIQFLVKHAAFIEEDECRMLYITNAGSEVIQEIQNKDGKSRLYIEYEPSVVEYLDKIYLSDGAKEERAFLERAWQRALDRDGITNKSIDIRDSDNPFRI